MRGCYRLTASPIWPTLSENLENLDANSASNHHTQTDDFQTDDVWHGSTIGWLAGRHGGAGGFERMEEMYRDGAPA